MNKFKIKSEYDLIEDQKNAVEKLSRNISRGIDNQVLLGVTGSGKKRTYVLKVKGESMIDEQIRDGDYVIIEQSEIANNGDIVVALLDNGMATLKRFFKEATRIRLEPANTTMSPIFVKNVRIQGKVVGLIRRYSA